jgi:hypothetical protein
MSTANKENNPTSAVHSKFTKLISSYTGDDPLIPYLEYELHSFLQSDHYQL